MTLFKHQQDLLTLNPKRHLLAWTTGVGKTLAVIELIFKNNQSPLIIVPKSIKEQWIEQIPDDWKVVTKEEFRRDWQSLPRYNCVVYDEAHYFSGAKSQMHRAAIKYCTRHKPEFVYAMTATPYLSTIMNIYALERLLGYNPNWYTYQNKYFYMVRMGSRMIPMQKPHLEAEVRRLVKKMGSIISLEECIDVPDQIFEKELFDLTTEQKKAIEDIEEINPIVKWSRTFQIENGTLKSDGFTEDVFYKSEKLERVCDLIREHKKIAVFCRHKLEIEYIKKNVKRQCFVISGDVPNRHEVVKAVEMADEAVVLIVSACSEGYELPSVPIIVYYSLSFSLKDYIQSMGRFLRINKPKKNVYIHLVNKPGTVDYDVYDCVVNKKMDFNLELYGKARS